MEYKVKDISQAKEGRLRVEWAESHMPVLVKIKDEFSRKKPLEDITIGACLHVTKETAVLMRTLKAAGATLALCGSNPLSTQDEVAAGLAEEGIRVFAWRGENKKEYYWCVNKVLDLKPEITLDDGADLINTIHTKRKELLKTVVGGQEETTTGVIRLRAMAKEGALKYPIIAVNDTLTKRMFDNVYGTGQSAIDGILRSTSLLLPAKNFVVCGYGYVGSGIAQKARGMGADVIVTEVDPVKALKAAMEGFKVMSMSKAAKIGDIFVTATGDKEVIRKEHLKLMKGGAIIANAGHFNVEISIQDLEGLARSKRKVRENVEEYTLQDGRKLHLLAEGRLINLAAAEGHPSEVMDMSFANQALCSNWLIDNAKKLKPDVYDVPEEIDRRVAELKLKAMGIKIDKLTPEQKAYLRAWKEGT